MAASQIVHDGGDKSQRDPRGVRFVGYLRGPRTDGLDCESPLLVLRNDDSREIWPCSNHKTSKCRPCATRYGRRVKSLASKGFSSPDGHFYLLTLTAPGDGLHCLRKGCDQAPTCGHPLCGCTGAEGTDLSRWNPEASRCWNRFLVAVERHYGARPAYFRATEVQDGKRSVTPGAGRGALHHHSILRTVTPLDVKTLRQLAIDAGYGHSIKLDVLNPGSRAAAHYVAKYITKACDERENVPWWRMVIDYETGEITEGLVPARYRTWSQSLNYSGVTMREIRAAALDKARQLAYMREITAGVREFSLTLDPYVSKPLATESPPLPS
jgi:hypothetical protein